MEAWPQLSAAALGSLASAAERGLLAAPFSASMVGRHVSITERSNALMLLERLHVAGVAGPALGAALRLAEASRRSAEDRPRPALVWSDLDLIGSRDTGVVCAELFREAKRAVTISTFNLGHRPVEGQAPGNPVLRPLAQRMAEIPGLRVRLFVNLRRMERRSAVSVPEVEAAFIAWLRRDIWPWDELPEIYYDPRSLEAEAGSCLHAKCVVVDGARAFVTSANLTEAAHERNIEAGVLLDDPVFASNLARQFDSLIDRGHVRRI